MHICYFKHVLFLDDDAGAVCVTEQLEWQSSQSDRKKSGVFYTTFTLDKYVTVKKGNTLRVHSH